MGNITVNISNVTLLNAIKDENYSQLLFNLMRYPPESEDYSYYEKQSII